VATALVAGPARAQFGDFLDRATQKAQEAVDRASQQPATPPPAERAAPADDGDEPPPPPKKAKAAKGGDGSVAPPPPSDVAAGEVYSARFDFVPGDKIFFFDDFSDTEVGDYPRRWTPGDDGGSTVEVAEIQGKRWLMNVPDEGGEGTREANTHIRTNLEKDLPEKFTIEFDVPSTANMCVAFCVRHWITGSDAVCFGPTYADLPWGGMKNENVARSSKPLRHVAIAISGTNLKVYFDGQRVLMHPDGVRVREPVRAIGFRFLGDEEKKRRDGRITNVKLASGGKDYSKELTSGRIVTHAITFDNGSDVIRPESGPTLRKILAILQENEGLKFEIQGHTDSQGGDKVNIPLSDKRAQAVKAWLVGQGIAASRLTTKGLGATKPLKPNDTAEGRAENRRVEFVKTSK
jgi:outer membrane protein OmpA-like peptidoglycan-associated protein